MEITKYKAEVGVIIGRFQTANLHIAHKELIDTVAQKHPRLVIVIGLSPCKATRNNPLDFEARKQMISHLYPEALIFYIKDTNSNELWSKRLDETINDVIGVGQKAVLYGGRDSFIPHYKGKWTTCELESEHIISASEIRGEIGIKSKPTADFREGVIWATMNNYPNVYPTVDVAIYDKAANKVLLGKKADENKYRFIGGFAEPKSPDYETDAKREVMEETGLSISSLTYLGSMYIDDWRYRNESSKIKTLFFLGYYSFGAARPNDDIAALKWFDVNDELLTYMVDEHKPLGEKLLKFLKNN